MAYDSLSQHEKAIGYFQQALPIAQAVQDRNVIAIVLRNLGIAYQAISQHERAIAYFQQALPIAQAVKDRNGEAGSLYGLGNIYKSLHQYEQAVGYYEKALFIYRALQDRNGENRILFRLGQTYGALKQYDRALGVLEQSSAIARQQQQRTNERLTLEAIAQTYNQMGQPDKATATRQQIATLPDTNDPRKAEANQLVRLAQVLIKQQQWQEALLLAQQAATIYQNQQDSYRETAALLMVGISYGGLEKPEQALPPLEKALAMARRGQYADLEPTISKALTLVNQQLQKASRAKTAREANALRWEGKKQSEAGQFDAAIQSLEKAIQIYRQIQDRGGEAWVLQTLGDTYRAMRQYNQAIDIYQKAIQINRQINDYTDEASTLWSLGDVYADMGQYQRAMEFYQQAIKSYHQAINYYKKIQNRQSEAIALQNLGRAYTDIGQYQQAIESYQQALNYYKSDDNPFDHAPAYALSWMGVTHLLSGNTAAAEAPLFEAIQILDSFIGEHLTDNDRIFIFDVVPAPLTYSILQQVLITQGKVEQALEVAGRGRAQAFLQLLVSKMTGNPIASLKPMTIREIKQVARDQNATLVQYSLIRTVKKGEDVNLVKVDGLYIWMVKSSGNITFRKVDLKNLWQQQDTNLVQLVEQSRDTIGARGRADIEVAISPERLKQQQEQQTQKLKQLHQILIEPIADLLPKDPNQRVIFVPQGELFLVPFPALLDANSKPLIDRHTILTAPSIQVLELTRQQRDRLTSRKSANNKSLIVGNPIMPKVVTRVGDTPVQLSNLPGAKQEALEIAKLFNTQAMTGTQATKVAIAQQMPNARIIHLATHGLLDDTKGLGVPGAIALAPVGNGQLNDGLLTSDEILDMKLNAELVVLSACDTGRGRITGDGVIGLSRSLFVAGVPSVIVSLWKVPDESTAFLMTEFYRNWKDRKLDKAQSLRQAILTTRDKYPQPLHWAAFTLIGEAE